ncbi:MAG TPA: ankyrin repeat domain-containing protein [Asticcacaulis sp.]|nr:ankyrin repeat domain-containing protein [Asticcacaulis sp.]
MKMRWLLPVLVVLSAGLPAAVLAGVAPRLCADADLVDLPRAGLRWQEDAAQTVAPIAYYRFRDAGLTPLFARPATIKYPPGAVDTYGFYVWFVVNAEGRVTCASLLSQDRKTPPVMNYKRQAFLDSVGDWRFKPFHDHDETTSVVSLLEVSEEEAPDSHVAMPTGDPAQTTVTFTMHSSFLYGAYHVELHGDGTAIYSYDDYDDSIGPQPYHLDPAAVQGLLAKAKTADFWSLPDLYRGWPNDYWSSVERINITVGGKTKGVTHYFDGPAGAPKALSDLSGEIMKVARVDFWRYPTLETIAQLKRNGYDFSSASAGHLLQDLTRIKRVKDEVLFTIMDSGAPLDARRYESSARGYNSLLDTALAAGRVEMARRLIAAGGLLKKGELDPVKVDHAFGQAIDSGDLAAVELILPFHPSLTYADPDDPTVQVSIIRKLGDDIFCEEPSIAIAQRLIALGADVNARLADGTTLLHSCAATPAFATFLLDHGANVNAADKEGWTPLASTYDEEVALLLLARGADPRLGKTGYCLRYYIKHNRWRVVKAWLESHGFSDVLVAQPDDDKPLS